MNLLVSDKVDRIRLGRHARERKYDALATAILLWNYRGFTREEVAAKLRMPTSTIRWKTNVILSGEDARDLKTLVRRILVAPHRVGDREPPSGLSPSDRR